MLTREFSFIGTFWVHDSVARPRIVFSNCDYGNDNRFYARMSRFQLDWDCIAVINYRSFEYGGVSTTYALEDLQRAFDSMLVQTPHRRTSWRDIVGDGAKLIARMLWAGVREQLMLIRALLSTWGLQDLLADMMPHFIE